MQYINYCFAELIEDNYADIEYKEEGYCSICINMPYCNLLCSDINTLIKDCKDRLNIFEDLNISIKRLKNEYPTIKYNLSPHSILKIYLYIYYN